MRKQKILTLAFLIGTAAFFSGAYGKACCELLTNQNCQGHASGVNCDADYAGNTGVCNHYDLLGALNSQWCSDSCGASQTCINVGYGSTDCSSGKYVDCSVDCNQVYKCVPGKCGATCDADSDCGPTSGYTCENGAVKTQGYACTSSCTCTDQGTTYPCGGGAENNVCASPTNSTDCNACDAPANDYDGDGCKNAPCESGTYDAMLDKCVKPLSQKICYSTDPCCTNCLLVAGTCKGRIPSNCFDSGADCYDCDFNLGCEAGWTEIGGQCVKERDYEEWDGDCGGRDVLCDGIDGDCDGYVDDDVDCSGPCLTINTGIYDVSGKKEYREYYDDGGNCNAYTIKGTFHHWTKINTEGKYLGTITLKGVKSESGTAKIGFFARVSDENTGNKHWGYYNPDPGDPNKYELGANEKDITITLNKNVDYIIIGNTGDKDLLIDSIEGLDYNTNTNVQVELNGQDILTLDPSNSGVQTVVKQYTNFTTINSEGLNAIKVRRDPVTSPYFKMEINALNEQYYGDPCYLIQTTPSETGMIIVDTADGTCSCTDYIENPKLGLTCNAYECGNCPQGYTPSTCTKSGTDDCCVKLEEIITAYSYGIAKDVGKPGNPCTSTKYVGYSVCYDLNVQYDASVFLISNHFTPIKVEDNARTGGLEAGDTPECGDGKPQPGAGENCATCPGDYDEQMQGRKITCRTNSDCKNLIDYIYSDKNTECSQPVKRVCEGENELICTDTCPDLTWTIREGRCYKDYCDKNNWACETSGNECYYSSETGRKKKCAYNYGEDMIKCSDIGVYSCPQSILEQLDCESGEMEWECECGDCETCPNQIIFSSVKCVQKPLLKCPPQKYLYEMFIEFNGEIIPIKTVQLPCECEIKPRTPCHDGENCFCECECNELYEQNDCTCQDKTAQEMIEYCPPGWEMENNECIRRVSYDAEIKVECDPSCPYTKEQNRGQGCSIKYYYTNSITTERKSEKRAVKGLITQTACECEGNSLLINDNEHACCPNSWDVYMINDKPWCCPENTFIPSNENAFPESYDNYHCCPAGAIWSEITDTCEEPGILTDCQSEGLTKAELECLIRAQSYNKFLWLIKGDYWTDALLADECSSNNNWVKKRQQNCNGITGSEYKDAGLEITNKELECVINSIVSRELFKVSNYQICVSKNCAEKYPEGLGNQCSLRATGCKTCNTDEVKRG